MMRRARSLSSAKVDVGAAHSIVMHDAAFDPISAIPAREHMKQEER